MHIVTQRHQRPLLQPYPKIRRIRTAAAVSKKIIIMKEIGWVKIHRKIMSWGWFYDGTMLKAMIWLICNANTQDSEYRGMKVRRGSLVTSRKEMASALSGTRHGEKVSEQQIRTILKRLQAGGEIIVKSTNFTTIITICKYDKYQDDINIFTNPSTSNQPAINQQSTSNQPHNKNIRIKEYNNILSHAREELTITDEEFDAIKVRYNQCTANILRPCKRLSLNTRMKIIQCLSTFGRGSLDKVFDEIKRAPWLTGKAPSGWRPDILWIFTPDNYQRILNGYFSQKAGRLQPQQAAVEIHIPSRDEILQEKIRKQQQDRNRILRIVQLADENPDSSAYQSVVNMYKSGRLSELNIDWKPKNKHNYESQ